MNKKENYQSTDLYFVLFDESFSQPYYEINIDEQLNKYWGYDYHNDLKNPTPEEFSKLALRWIKDKTSLIYMAISKENGEVIGEGVIDDLQLIGYRVFQKYHGRGYGNQIASFLIHKALIELEIPLIRSKCYKENLPSTTILSSLMNFDYSDEKMNYYYQSKLTTVDDYLRLLGKKVKIVIDRPKGYNHKGIVYQLDYGYLAGYYANDNEEVDAYVLDDPHGQIIAVIQRIDDNENKLVVASRCYTAEEIKKLTDFQEKYFQTKIILL